MPPTIPHCSGCPDTLGHVPHGFRWAGATRTPKQQFRNQNRQGNQRYGGEIYEHECSSPVLPRHVWELPYVAKPYGSAYCRKNEAGIRRPIVLNLHGMSPERDQGHMVP